MAFSKDLSDQVQRNGSVAGNLAPSVQAYRDAQKNINRLGVSDAITVLNSERDLEWASSFENAGNNNIYFDYFYSGQDIQVYIDGADDQPTGGLIPVTEMAWSIKQEKTPLYGFWSYTFDAMMLGSRIVNGVFRIATTRLNYMRDLLASAATNRANQTNVNSVIRGLDEDEANIEKYWTKNIDPTISAKDNKHLWSSHPPFNFVIVYGVQNVSVNDLYASDGYKDTLARYKNAPALMADTNERLVAANPERLDRYVIENVELTTLQVEYAPDGQPIAETYSFVARDLFTA